MGSVVKLVRWICMALSIGFVPAWVDLMGHTQLLSVQADVIDANFTNAHYCLLTGMILGGLAVALFARAIDKHPQRCALIAGALGCALTIVYAVVANGIALGVLVAISGFTIIFLYAGVFTLHARTAKLATITSATIGGMAAKAVMMPLVDAVFPGVATVVVTSLDPLTAALLAAASARLAHAKETDATRNTQLDALAVSGARTTVATIVLVAISALVFAMTRAGSNLQLWGSAHVTPPMTVGMGIAATVVFCVMCYATFMQTPRDTMLRFLPSLAIQLVAYGLLWLGLLGELGITTQAGEALFSTYTEVYSHTFYFAVTFFGFAVLGGARAVRVNGLQWAFFSAVLFVAAIVGLSTTSPVRFAIAAALYVTLAVAFVVAHLMYGQDQVDAIQSVQGAVGAQEESVASEPAPAAPAVQTNPVVQTIDAISARYELSEREHDVLELLAQGRTRASIGDELGLASGTVSTYVTRIYEKVRVHSKQELLSVVYQQVEASAARKSV